MRPSGLQLIFNHLGLLLGPWESGLPMLKRQCERFDGAILCLRLGWTPLIGSTVPALRRSGTPRSAGLSCSQSNATGPAAADRHTWLWRSRFQCSGKRKTNSKITANRSDDELAAPHIEAGAKARTESATTTFAAPRGLCRLTWNHLQIAESGPFENASMNRRERRADARKSRGISSGPGANTPAALCEAGLRHLRAEQYLDAQLCCQQALAADPDHADTLHLMGLLSFHAVQYDLAAEWFSRAIRRDAKPQYLASLGTTLQNQGRFEEALQVFEKAVQLKPDAAVLWKFRGNVLVNLDRRDQAVLSLQHALKLNPRDRDAAYNCGALLFQLGRLDEALACFDLCDQLQPNHFPTLQKRSLALCGLGRLDEALADSKRAHALDPTNADICNHTGTVLKSLGRHQEALSWFDRTLELRPNHVGTLNDKAFSLIELRRFDEAFAVYHRSKAIDPGHAATDWNMALLQMMTGNFEAGWAGREVRWKTLLPGEAPKISKPIWLGDEPIAGKTILLHSDEGLGDAIQFCRYVPMLAARGARVILVIEDALYPLLSGITGVSHCLPKSTATLPAFDLHCPLSSLPLAFGTRLDSIPAVKSYLPAPAADRVRTWEDRLGPHDKLRVGLVWSGNPKHDNDRNRSIPLGTLARILDLDATFVSLQKDPRPDARATLLERSEIVDPTSHLTDFAETAAFISCLDLVISADTSVAHLAAALGRPTWILLPYTPDYRWLLDRDDSPWYPTVRLFRQTATREYGSVVDRVRTELRAMIGGGSTC
jgi:tetratricopeptide (TPR) repeat protein